MLNLIEVSFWQMVTAIELIEKKKYDFSSSTDLNCVEKMQVSSENMKAPFEILIQGPGSDRFVRSLMAVDKSSASDTAESTDSRLTFSVHQPDTEQSTAEEPPKEATKDADNEKQHQPSCRAEDFMKKDDTAMVEPKINEGNDASPTLRSKRQSGNAAQADGSIGEEISEAGSPDAQPNDPKVGGPFGLLGPAIAARVGIPAAIGLGHLGILHRGLRIHNAAGIHHALLPLRHALHHAPLIPLLGAANPNAGGEPVGQENPNAQAMPSSDSAPPQAGQDVMNNPGSMFVDRVNHHIQNLQNIQNAFRQMVRMHDDGLNKCLLFNSFDLNISESRKSRTNSSTSNERTIEFLGQIIGPNDHD